jgi:ABC-2 type transport system permease protein
MAPETDTATATTRLHLPGSRLWLRQAGAFAARSVRELFRNKTVLFWSIGFPVGFYLLTVTVFVDTTTIPADALPAVKAGTAVSYGIFGAIIACLNAFGQQLAIDLEDERYRLYRSLPIGPGADLAGRMAAGFVLSVVALLAAMGVAVLTGATFSLRAATSIPVIAVALLAFAVFWMVAAVVVVSLVRETRYASIITVSIALAAYFLTGYNGGDPSVFQGPDVLLNWLPNTLATRLVSHHVVVFSGDVSGSAGSGASLAIPGDVFGIGVLGLWAVGALVVGVAIMRRRIYQRGILP